MNVARLSAMRPVAFVVLVACGRINFDPLGSGLGDDVQLGDGGGDGGGNGDGVVATGCVDPGSGCGFDGTVACSCWGLSPITNNATVMETGSHLRITPAANIANAMGSCTLSSVPFNAGGATIELSQVVSGNQSLTGLQVGGGGNGLIFGVQGTQISAQDGSGTLDMIPYVATEMRWWRIRPSGTGAIFETSPDGLTWNLFASTTQTPLPAYGIRVFAGTLGGEAVPGFAQIESTNMCPP
jgi:hypothetical protein